MYINERVEKKLEEIKEWMEGDGKEVITIVRGDFNARTGEKGEEVRGEKMDKERERRRLKNKRINAEKKMLIDRLEEAG